MTADVDLTIVEDVWELLPDGLEGVIPGLVALTVELTVELAVGRAFLTDEPSSFSFWVVLELGLDMASWPTDFGFLGSLLGITRCGLYRDILKTI